MEDVDKSKNEKLTRLYRVEWGSLIVSLLTLLFSSYIAFIQHQENVVMDRAKLTPQEYGHYYFEKVLGARQYKTISGVVWSSDRENVGIEGVDISIILGPNLPHLSTQTSENGIYEILIPIFKDTEREFNSYIITAAKNEFQPYVASCPLDAFPEGCDVYLTRE